MEWERARTEEQKYKRIAEIVSATERLFEKYSYEDITFVLIAKEANFTRSNLYKYFNSKEEIFLEFFKRDIEEWRKELVGSYREDRDYSVEQFADIWVSVMNKRKRLLDLIGIWFASLESQCSFETLTEFKLGTLVDLKALRELMCRLFPRLSPEKAEEFIHLQIASAIGLYQMTNLSEVQQNVLENPELKGMKIEFDEYYRNSVMILITGMLNQHQKN